MVLQATLTLLEGNNLKHNFLQITSINMTKSEMDAEHFKIHAEVEDSPSETNNFIFCSTSSDGIN